MDASARLEEYLEQPTETKEQFRIEDKETAIWALRKLVKIEQNRNDARAAAQAEIDRIQAWLTEEEEKADRERGFFDFLLEDYHRRVIAENPKAKTIKLPHGELQLRAQHPEYQKNDNRLLLWAMKNMPHLVTFPVWVRPDPKLDWAELKKTLKTEERIVVDKASGEIVDRELIAVNPATGAQIPGVTVMERPAKFSIKLNL